MKNKTGKQPSLALSYSPAARFLLIAYCTFFCTLTFPLASFAQNPTYHYDDIQNMALDYMAIGNKYMLLGRTSPATVGGMSNAAAISGNNARIHLQVIDPGPLNTISTKTYCTVDEVNDVINNVCTGLNVAFYPADAKQTADGGFIICGEVRRDLETDNCNLTPYHNPFLLKVNSSGGVQWYKRYADNINNKSLHFASVVEDALTGNVIVCGSYDDPLNSRAFMMATDNTGAYLNAHLMNMRLYSDTTWTPTDYREVTSYVSGGNQYYVMVGSSFSYMPVEGGILITVVDASGNIQNNGVVTSAGHDIAVMGYAVNDAYDGDVVITGDALPYNNNLQPIGPYTYDFAPYVLKINPMTLPIPANGFMNMYQIPNRYVLPTSITRLFSDHGLGNIALTGDDRTAGDFFLEVNSTGNFVGYDLANSTDGDVGFAIINDAANLYAVYSGQASNIPNSTFLTTDEYNANTCASNVSIQPIAIPHDPHMSIPNPIFITKIDDNAVDFSPTTNEMLVCGIAMKGGTTTSVNNAATTTGLKLSPNPAINFLDIKIPSDIQHGDIRIMDIAGRTMLTRAVNNTGGTLHLDISSLNAGIYMMTIEHDGIKEQSPFVKQ